MHDDIARSASQLSHRRRQIGKATLAVHQHVELGGCEEGECKPQPPTMSPANTPGRPNGSDLGGFECQPSGVKRASQRYADGTIPIPAELEDR